MNLVLRRGVLHLGESYIFTLHVTDDSLDGEGAASITLHHNMPPDGGECRLRRAGEASQASKEDTEDDVWRIKTLLDRVQFSCSGKLEGRPRSRARCTVLSFQKGCFPFPPCLLVLLRRLQRSGRFGDSSALQSAGDPLQRGLLRGLLRVQRQQPRTLGLPAPGLQLRPPPCVCLHLGGRPSGSCHQGAQQVSRQALRLERLLLWRSSALPLCLLP